MQFANLRTVIFDLDGTLCRYRITTADALAATLNQAGFPPDTLGDLTVAAARYLELWHAEEQVQSDIPFRARIWIRLLADHGIDDPELARRLGDMYIDIRLPSLELDPDAVSILTALRPRFQLGLLTNGPSEMQWPKIHRLGLTSYFDTVVVAGDVGIYKPDPRVFTIALARLGGTADTAVYIGDSYAMDVIGAKRAGLHCVWVKHPTNTELVDSIHPDVEIDALSRLMEVL